MGGAEGGEGRLMRVCRYCCSGYVARVAGGQVVGLKVKKEQEVRA